MTTKIYNGTDHDLHFFSREDVDDSNPRKLVLKPGANPKLTLPRQVPLNAEQQEVVSDHLLGIPIYEVEPKRCDKLPEGYDAFIVSALFGSAIKQIAEIAEEAGDQGSRLVQILGIKDPVYKKLEDGSLQVAGCLGLRQVYTGFVPEG